MGTQQVIKLAETLITQGVKKARYVTPTCRVGTAEQLGLKLEQIAGDTVQIRNKSPLGEFLSYMKRIEQEGKSFKPTFEKPNSPFAQFYKYEQASAIEYGREAEISLCEFKDFLFDHEFVYKGTFSEEMMKMVRPNITPNEYWQIVDKYCEEIANKVRANPSGLRQEFVDNAGKIQKWAEIFRTQNHYSGWNEGPIEIEQYSKFYDEQMYNQAVEEFVSFVEKITGKKVLIGCKSRLNFAVSSLSVLNNPKTYKDIDYIVMGHGKGESWRTDLSRIDSWRFSDNDKSVWEFIEQNIPKGKSVLALCCEKGSTYGHVDLSGNKMIALGNPVSCHDPEWQPLKICESGIRHLKGHIVATERPKCTALSEISTENYCNNIAPINNTETVYYNLDFDKYRVENLV